MARDINSRIARLNSRRKGLDRVGRVSTQASQEILNKSLYQEDWQSRSKKEYTRYALGSMQEVGKEYTGVSIETANRVADQLRSGLESEGYSVDFRLQGSVPLNVHIRGVSDVDLLTLDIAFLTYYSFGSMAKAGRYTASTSKTSVGVLSSLRTASEAILERRYPAATVDKTGAKAISIYGGSLARSVDVVPSHWHDNEEYQLSQDQSDRTVTILNNKNKTTIDNLPFLHIKNVTIVDNETNGGIKKAIRLCKNVKNDAIEEGTPIELPSFDIASLIYHIDRNAVSLNSVYELSVLAETQRFLDVLYNNEGYAKSLRTPDNSRFIIDNNEKYSAVRRLSIEVDDLAKEVAKEQADRYIGSGEISLSDSRATLNSRLIIE
mgnify:CR=1 FL=1